MSPRFSRRQFVPAKVSKVERTAMTVKIISLIIQYKGLKLDINRGKSKKFKTVFVVSPIMDLDGFYKKPFSK